MAYDREHPSLTKPSNCHYCFYCDDIIIGAVQIEQLSTREVAIRTLAIDASWQEKGYGAKLLRLTEKEILSMGCTMVHLHANPKAYGFYMKQGYSEIPFFDPEATTFSGTVDMGKIIQEHGESC